MALPFAWWSLGTVCSQGVLEGVSLDMESQVRLSEVRAPQPNHTSSTSQQTRSPHPPCLIENNHSLSHETAAFLCYSIYNDLILSARMRRFFHVLHENSQRNGALLVSGGTTIWGERTEGKAPPKQLNGRWKCIAHTEQKFCAL